MFDHLATGKWWDIGLDLVPGCTPVSPGCENCWSAEKTHRAGCQRNPKIRARYGGLTDAHGRWTGEVRPQWQDLDKIGAARKPQVYTFWNDLFHPGVPDEFVTSVMLRILPHPQHFGIICTKRPERALEYFSQRDFFGNGSKAFLSARLMLMTTAENQAMYDERISYLKKIPGVLHGLSLEPMLGPINLCTCAAHLPGTLGHLPNCPLWPGSKLRPEKVLNWLIMGGETGPHARPMHPDIPRKLRDDCQAAGVPFFVKALHINGKISKNMNEWPEDLRIRQVPNAI